MNFFKIFHFFISKMLCASAAPSCSAFSHKPEMCTDPQTAAEALKGCPATCGLCTKPGANGVCSDTPGAPCEELKPALSCYNKYMRQNCMRTCKFDDCVRKILNIFYIILKFLLNFITSSISFFLENYILKIVIII